MCANDLQILLDFCGTPQIDAVERVKGTSPISQPVDWQRIFPVSSTGNDRILYQRRTLVNAQRPSVSARDQQQPTRIAQAPPSSGVEAFKRFTRLMNRFNGSEGSPPRRTR